MNASTFDPAHLPDFSYVVPNLCDDMHTFRPTDQACPAYFGPNTGTDMRQHERQLAGARRYRSCWPSPT